MKNFRSPLVFVLAGMLAAVSVAAQNTSQPLLHGRHAHPEAADVGGLPATRTLNLTIGLPLRNQAGLDQFLQELYDPASPSYRHFLTPQEFTERFGPTKEDYAAVTAYAQANGLTVDAPDSGRVLVTVHAPVAVVEKAFHVRMRSHQHPTEARQFFAPDVEPTLDLEVPIQDIGGLDNYVVPRPASLVRKKQSQQTAGRSAFPSQRAGAVPGVPMTGVPQPAGQTGEPIPQSGSGPGGTYAGKDFRAAYAPGVTLTGTGQSVGLFEFGGYYSNDIVYYQNYCGYTNYVPIVNVLVNGESSITNNPGGEEALDIEMEIDMAPGMTSLYYYFGDSCDSIISRIASDDAVHQVSASWLYGTDGSTDGLYQQLAAEGITFFTAAGDYDAYPVGTSIDACCSTPYVTCVGGTTLSTTGPGGAWSSETVWNWGGGAGGSGGISTTYPIPSWQTGISMTANHGSTTMRNIPDVALTADNIDLYYDGGWEDVGGTSCATPLWAGFMALINEQGATTGLPPVGAFNPAVYALGKGAGYSAAMRDITTGNNFKTASPTNFPAVAGYDLATGWGTPLGQATINAFAPPTALVITPLAGFVSAGWPGGPFSVNSQVFALTNISATASFNWSLSNTSTWLTVTAASGVMATNGSTNVVISLNSGVADSLAQGTYTATVVFTSQAVTQTRSFSLFIGNTFAAWTGGWSPNGNWSAATNWLGNTAPTNGANLLFTGSSQPVNTNDVLSTAGWVQLNPGTAFTFYGNALSLTSGLTNAAQNNFWNIPLALGANQNMDVASNTTLTVGGAISGGNRLAKTSAGTLILTGTNTYTGATTISAGTLLVGGAGTLGNGEYAGNITNNSAFIYASTATDTLTGVISGPGTLAQQGLGNLTLAGANTYTGPTTINGGSTLVIGPGGSLGAGNYTNLISGGGGLAYNGTGTQSLSGANTFSGNVTVNSGTLSATGTSQSQLGANTAPGRSLTINPGATLTLADNNTTTGTPGSSTPAIIINGGTVNATRYNASGLNAYGSGLTLQNSGVLFVNNTGVDGNPYYGWQLGDLVTVAGTSGSVITNSASGDSKVDLYAPATTFNVASTGGAGPDLTVYAALVNQGASGTAAAAGLTKTGPGVMTLLGANTYTGGTVVGGGTLALTGAASIASSPAIAVGSSALFDVSGLASIFTLGSSQTLTAGSPSPGAGVTNLNGNLKSGGAINIAGTGTNGTLTINGNLALTGGTLQYDLGANSDLIALAGAGRTLSLSGTTTIQPTLGLNNGAYTLITNFASIPAGTAANLALSGAVVRGGTAVLTVAVPAVTLTVSGGAAANLVWQGTNGLNWDTVTTNWLNSGTSLPDQFYSLDNVSFDDTGMAGVSLVGTLYPGSVTVSSANTNYNFGGSGSLGGTTTLTKSGTSTLSITNNNSYTGGTAISAGIVRVANPNALGSGPLAMTGGTLDVNVTNLNLQTLSGATGTLITDLNTNGTVAVTDTLTVNQVVSNTFAGTIANGASNSIALVMNGPGYLLLTGADTYGGGTTVNAGTLEVTGNSGAKKYTVAQGATLKIGYSVNASYGYGITVNGNGVTDPSGFYLKSGQSINLESALTLQGMPSKVRVYGGASAGTLAGYDVNYTMLSVAATASGSILDTNINISCADYGYNMNIAAGTNTVAGDLTINGVISGSGSVTWNGVAVNLEKYGAGSLLLTNVSTSTGYGIGAGTLMLAGGNNRLPATANVVLGDNGASGMLQLNGVNQTLASIITYGSGTASAVVGGSATLSTLTINNSSALTSTVGLGGPEAYQNNLALVKTGAGQLVLPGLLTYTGGTTISAGTVVAGTLANVDGETLSVTDVAGTLTATNLTLGVFTGSTVAITGFAGAASAPIVVTNLTANGVTTISLAGTYSAGDYPLIKFLSGKLGGTGSFTAQTSGLPRGYAAVIVTNAANQSIDVLLTANNPLVWAGATNGVSTANWDNGITTNWSLLGSPNFFTNNDNVQINDSAIGSTTLTLAATVNPLAVLVTNNAKNFTLSATGAAALAGGMSLTKQGAGVLTMTESNSFTGGVTIGGGAVNVQNGRAFNTNTVTVAGGAELQLQGGISVPAVTRLLLGSTGTNNTGGLRNLGGTNTFGGQITLSAATRINSDSGILTLTNGVAAGTNWLALGGSGNTVISNATVSGTAALVKDGNGTNIWYVNPAITNSWVTVSNGTFEICVNNLGGGFTPRLAVNPGTTLWGNGTNSTGGGTALVLNQGTWLLSGEDYKTNLTLVDGLIGPGPNPVSAGGELRAGFAGGSGNYAWQVSNSVAGSIVNTKLNTLGSGVNLVWNVARGAAASDLTVNGCVYGAGSIMIAGNGVTTLTCPTNYNTGALTVGGGTLLLTGALGTNSVTVATNATLMGNGVIQGATTIQIGGTLQPGLGGGDTSSLAVSNNLVLAGNTRLVLNRTNAQTASGVAGVALANYGGTLTISNAGPALQAGDTFRLFSAASYSGAFASVALPALAPPLAWNTNNLAVSGSLAVFNTTPGTNVLIGITSQGSSLTVSAIGVPGYNYVLERATNLVPAVWVVLATNTAATNGLVNATDSFGDLGNVTPGAAFYRFIWQP